MQGTEVTGIEVRACRSAHPDARRERPVRARSHVPAASGIRAARVQWAHRAGVFHETVRYLAEHARRREPLLEPLADAVLPTPRRAGPRGYDPQRGGTPRSCPPPRANRAPSTAAGPEPCPTGCASSPDRWRPTPRRHPRTSVSRQPIPWTCPPTPNSFGASSCRPSLSTGLLISNEAAGRLLGAHEEHVRAAAIRPAPGPTAVPQAAVDAVRPATRPAHDLSPRPGSPTRQTGPAPPSTRPEHTSPPGYAMMARSGLAFPCRPSTGSGVRGFMLGQWTRDGKGQAAG